MTPLNKKLIYIAGYGRSGSTLLERILSSHEFIQGIGEASIFFSVNDRSRFLCACGEPLESCPFWSGVVCRPEFDSVSSSHYRKIQRGFESIFAIGNYITGRNWFRRRAYRSLMESFMGGIYPSLPNPSGYLLDSSKTPHDRLFRPIALAKVAGFEVKVIHLVRDGKSCIRSVAAGSNRKMEKGVNPVVTLPGLRAALGWLMANMAAQLCQWVLPAGCYCRIRYEDFIDHHRVVLKELGDFLDVDLSSQIAMLDREAGIPQIHQLGGNRLRFSDKLVLKKSPATPPKLSLWQNLCFWFFDAPLSYFYGYLKR